MSEKNVGSDLPFEKALEQLESIVSKMEEGELSLDEMIRYYEEGSRLSKLCAAKLQSFEKKIEILSRDDGKEGVWRDFDPESGKRLSTAAENPEENDDPEKDSLF